MARFELSPATVFGLVRELRAAAADVRVLQLDGVAGGIAALRHELERGAAPGALRDGGDVRDAGALLYALDGPAGEDDERRLRAARNARTPTVCVQFGRDGVDVPYVLATDVVVVPPATPLPVDEIARALAHRVGEPATGLAARVPALRRGVCAALIEKFSRTNGLLGAAIFLPGADLPVLTLNQLRLVLRIGAAHGVDVDARRAPEILGVVGAGLGFRAAARQVLGVVPLAGWALKGVIAYAGTRALGEAAVRYFERAGVAKAS